MGRADLLLGGEGGGVPGLGAARAGLTALGPVDGVLGPAEPDCDVSLPFPGSELV